MDPIRRQRAGAAFPAVAAMLAASLILGGCGNSSARSDYRSRMQSVNTAAAFDAPGKPDASLLPTGQEWITHIQQDLLPYWTTPVALGNPVGNFLTFLAGDGSLIPANLRQRFRPSLSRCCYLLGTERHLRSPTLFPTAVYWTYALMIVLGPIH